MARSNKQTMCVHWCCLGREEAIHTSDSSKHRRQSCMWTETNHVSSTGNEQLHCSSEKDGIRKHCISVFLWLWLLAGRRPFCFTAIIVSAYRYIAITTLAIIAVFLEHLRQFLIDLNQIYRHSSVPKNTSPCIFPAF